MQDATTLQEPARALPVYGEYDVVVVGGGPAGEVAAGRPPTTTTSKLRMDPHPNGRQWRARCLHSVYNARASQPRGRQASTWSVRGVGCESRYRRPRKTPVTTNANDRTAVATSHDFPLAV